MNPPSIDRAVHALRDLFARSSAVRSAILYGSCARGTAREDSEIDVLVLASGPRVRPLREGIHDLEDILSRATAKRWTIAAWAHHP